MTIKNKLGIKRSFMLIAFIAVSISSLAFDYKISIFEKSFEDENYNFFIQKVIDARLNKQKPIGALVAGFSVNKETVGNDSLGEQMISVFNKKPEIFNVATKVIMVINQLSLRYLKSADGKKTELEYSIAVDYYLTEAKTYGLLYQQFFKYKVNVKSADKIARDIDKGFSETIKHALADLKKQLKTNKAVVRKEFNADSLLQSLTNKPVQVLTNQNVQDGLYFSCRDLYLNKPGILDSYSFTDTTGMIGTNPLIVKSPGYLMERVYAIVRDKRIFIYTGGGNYKEAVFGNDGKLFIPSMANISLVILEKGSSASIGILNTLHTTTTTTTAIAATIPSVDKGVTVTATDSTAKRPIKQPETGYKATDFYLDLETGDLVSLVP